MFPFVHVVKPSPFLLFRKSVCKRKEHRELFFL